MKERNPIAREIESARRSMAKWPEWLKRAEREAERRPNKYVQPYTARGHGVGWL